MIIKGEQLPLEGKTDLGLRQITLVLIIIWSNKAPIRVTCGGSNLIKAFDLQLFHNWIYSVSVAATFASNQTSSVNIFQPALATLCPGQQWASGSLADSQLPNPQFWPKNLPPHPTLCGSAANPGSSFTRPKMSRVDPDGGALKCQTIHCLYHWRGGCSARLLVRGEKVSRSQKAEVRANIPGLGPRKAALRKNPLTVDVIDK